MRALVCFFVLLTSCSTPVAKKDQPPAAPVFFKVDPTTASTVSGVVHFTGKLPASTAVDMSNEPACPQTHPQETAVSSVFVYVKTGLEGKTFAAPATPVVIDQKGCWFHPHVLGVQTGQILRVVNSDPVTHNIHPLATVNREWNHSQGEGDPPLIRKFLKPEVLIPVKCNIHSWMHAFIGVVSHPYFAVSTAGGAFPIPNLPPGQYTLEAVHPTLGAQQVTLSIAPASKNTADFTFKGQ